MDQRRPLLVTLTSVALAALAIGAAACSDDSGSGGEGVASGSSTSSGSSGGPTSSGGASGSSSGGSSSGGSADAGASVPSKPLTYTKKTLSFDELPAGTTLTDQYAKWVTLTTDPGCALSTSTSAGVAASKPNYVWTYYSCQNGPSASYFVTFAKPVKNVAFTLVGVNGSAKVATARITKKDGTTTTTDVIGKGSSYTPVVVPSTAEDVTKLEIVDVKDAFGLGLDDLVFDFPDD